MGVTVILGEEAIGRHAPCEQETARQTHAIVEAHLEDSTARRHAEDATTKLLDTPRFPAHIAGLGAPRRPAEATGLPHRSAFAEAASQRQVLVLAHRHARGIS